MNRVLGNPDRRSATRRLVDSAFVLAVAAGLAGCAIFASDTHETREKAQTLVPGQWHRDYLHCAAKECSDWYMVNVDRPGELRVDVYSPAVPGHPDYRMRLEDIDRNTLAEVEATGQSPRKIRRTVKPGLYMLHIRAAEVDGQRLEYEVLAEVRDPAPAKKRRKTARRPPPKAPEPVWLDAEVLEVERDGGEPRYVLIDAGTPKGVRAGLSGRLVEGGRPIGEFEVIEVYRAGSRARLTGPLEGSITIDTKAQIALPRPER